MAACIVELSYINEALTYTICFFSASLPLYIRVYVTVISLQMF